MNHKLTADNTTAVDLQYELQPMDTAPCGVKVQLLTLGHVLVYGVLSSNNLKDFLAWAPCPKKPSWLKS